MHPRPRLLLPVLSAALCLLLALRPLPGVSAALAPLTWNVLTITALPAAVLAAIHLLRAGTHPRAERLWAFLLISLALDPLLQPDNAQARPVGLQLLLGLIPLVLAAGDLLWSLPPVQDRPENID